MHVCATDLLNHKIQCSPVKTTKITKDPTLTDPGFSGLSVRALLVFWRFSSHQLIEFCQTRLIRSQKVFNF